MKKILTISLFIILSGVLKAQTTISNQSFTFGENSSVNFRIELKEFEPVRLINDSKEALKKETNLSEMRETGFADREDRQRRRRGILLLGAIVVIIILVA